MSTVQVRAGAGRGLRNRVPLGPQTARCSDRSGCLLKGAPGGPRTPSREDRTALPALCTASYAIACTQESLSGMTTYTRGSTSLSSRWNSGIKFKLYSTGGTPKESPRKACFAFSGLIACGHCGCSLVGEIKKQRYVYYHCSGYKGGCEEPLRPPGSPRAPLL